MVGFVIAASSRCSSVGRRGTGSGQKKSWARAHVSDGPIGLPRVAVRASLVKSNRVFEQGVTACWRRALRGASAELGSIPGSPLGERPLAWANGSGDACRRDRGRRPRRAGQQPRQGVLPGPGRDQAGPGPVLRGRGRGSPPGGLPAPHRPQALSRRRHRGAVLPEAGAQGGAGVARHRPGDVPVGPSRRRAVPHRRRPPRVGRQPGVPRPQPLGRAPQRRRPARRAAGRPGPPARRPVLDRPRRGGAGACGPRGARVRRLPQDLGVPRRARERADRAPVGLPRGPAGGARAVAGRRAGDAHDWPPPSGGRRSAATGCSSTTTRTPATGRSRRRTPCGRTRRAGCRARSPGPSWPKPTPATSPSPPSRRASPPWATRRPRSTTCTSRWSRCSSWPPATRPKASATSPGHPTSPSSATNPAASNPASASRRRAQ